MTKPITVERQEFIDSVVNIINASPLPSFVVLDALKTIIPSLEANLKREYETDAMAYIKALQAEESTLNAEEQKQPVDEKNNKKKGGK